MRMKLLILLTIPFIIISKGAICQAVEDNAELKEIYKADQSDRQSSQIDWRVVSRRDSARMARVYELLESNKVITGADYHNAAMIFQHGLDTVASRMAVKMMRKAIEVDPSTNKWLLAAAIDRDLMRRNEPQIYGTQYTKSGENDPWTLWKIDTTVITDQQRREYGVETLAQQRQKVKLMNKKSPREIFADGRKVDEAIKMIRSEFAKGERSIYNVSESGLNSLGYEFKNEKKSDAALAIFTLNTELFPRGYNTWDSLGEFLLESGKEKEAIVAYKKSLELNPKNTNAQRVIEAHKRK